MGRLGTLSVLTTLAFGLGAARVPADDGDLVIGGEVRLTTSERMLTGTLAEVTKRTITVREKDTPVEVPRAELRKLEVMNPGRKAHLDIWGGGGAAVGVLLGLTAAGACFNCSPEERRDTVLVASVVGGLALGAIGLAIGKLAERKPHWEEVEMSGPKIRVGILPVAGRGVRVAVALAF